MPPLTPPTMTRLDPAYPLLWRDVDTVQFGLEGKVLVSLSEPWIEPLLQALRDGFRRSSFDVLAHGVGAPREAARELLAKLRPVLRTDSLPPPPVWIESINMADSRVEARVENTLMDEGLLTAARAAPGAVGIVLVQGAASAHHLARYLHDDLAHLPIAFEPGGTTVGPLVIPGHTPCLACRDAHERDRDAAWPSLHAQLIGASSGHITAVRSAEAAGLAARILAESCGAKKTKSVRVSPDGRRGWRAATFHEECQCRGQSFRSPEGTETAASPLDRRHEPTTRPEFARRA